MTLWVIRPLVSNGAPTEEIPCCRIRTDQVGLPYNLVDPTVQWESYPDGVTITGQTSGATGRFVSMLYQQTPSTTEQFQQYMILTDWSGIFECDENLLWEPVIGGPSTDSNIDTALNPDQRSVDCDSGNPLPLPPLPVPSCAVSAAPTATATATPPATPTSTPPAPTATPTPPSTSTSTATAPAPTPTPTSTQTFGDIDFPTPPPQGEESFEIVSQDPVNGAQLWDSSAEQWQVAVQIGGNPAVGIGQGHGVIRFTNLPIPPGATIVDCDLQVWNTPASLFRAVDATIYADKQQYPPGFEGGSGTIADRASRATTAQVTWDTSDVTNGNASAGDQYVSVPSLTTVLQEIVDQSWWEFGGDVAFVIQANPAVTNQILGYAAPGFAGGGAQSPVINITYELASAATSGVLHLPPKHGSDYIRSDGKLSSKFRMMAPNAYPVFEDTKSYLVGITLPAWRPADLRGGYVLLAINASHYSQLEDAADNLTTYSSDYRGMRFRVVDWSSPYAVLEILEGIPMIYPGESFTAEDTAGLSFTAMNPLGYLEYTKSWKAQFARVKGGTGRSIQAEAPQPTLEE